MKPSKETNLAYLTICLQETQLTFDPLSSKQIPVKQHHRVGAHSHYSLYTYDVTGPKPAGDPVLRCDSTWRGRQDGHLCLHPVRNTHR